MRDNGEYKERFIQGLCMGGLLAMFSIILIAILFLLMFSVR